MQQHSVRHFPPLSPMLMNTASMRDVTMSTASMRDVIMSIASMRDVTMSIASIREARAAVMLMIMQTLALEKTQNLAEAATMIMKTACHAKTISMCHGDFRKR